MTDSETGLSVGTPSRLRRLRRGIENAPPVADADSLADEIKGLSMAGKVKNRFADMVASVRKAADWSSDENSDEGAGLVRPLPEEITDSESEAGPSHYYSGPQAKPNPPPHSSRRRDSAAGRRQGSKPVSQPGSSQDSADPAGHSAELGAALTLGAEGELKIPHQVASRLYEHQISGIQWLWSLHKMQKGGILGDDMGLGKTLQCSAFLAGMLKSKLIRRALVVAPKTLLAHWKKELAVSGIGSLTHELSPQASQGTRDFELAAVFREPGVLLTTYGMVQHNAELLCHAPWPYDEEEASEKPLWDFLILDEGHKIKNAKTQIAQQLREIPVAVAVIISGTPIQNNIMELFALFDFVCPGLLGDQRIFKREYEQVITRGNSRDATGRDRELAGGRSRALRERYAPFFLRREKKDILKMAGESDSVEGEACSSTAPVPQKMGRKNDFVVWLKLQPTQKKIYEAFLNSQAVKEALNSTQSPLAAITVLKKICVHPNLLSERAADAVITGGGKLAKGRRVVTEDDFIAEDSEVEYLTPSSSEAEESEAEVGASQPESGQGESEFSADELWAEWAGDDIVEEKLRDVVKSKGIQPSCKSMFVASLLKELHAEGHRTLIFSQSRVMLDITGRSLREMKIGFLRIDGSLSAAQRQAAVHEFQTRQDIPAMLLTSQVGGLGLTLTAADRVIILDPAWNPATDDQSVDRAYRIGQSRDVVVYRLISCGTVEEKIYRKQVFKGGLFRHGMEEGIPFQYFSKQEMRDLFRVDAEELEKSTTQQQLHDLHSAERKASEELRLHLLRLEQLPCFSGVSDHDLLFSRKMEPTGESTEPSPAFPTNFENKYGRPYLDPHRAATAKPRAKMVPKGWQGSEDISDLLAKNLTLGRKTNTGAAAKPPGAGWASPKAKPGLQRGPQPALSHLEEQLQRLKALQNNLGARLPDGGRQLQDKRAALERQIAHLTNAADGDSEGSVVVLSSPTCTQNPPRRERTSLTTEVVVLDSPAQRSTSLDPAAPAQRKSASSSANTASRSRLGAGGSRNTSPGSLDAEAVVQPTFWDAEEGVSTDQAALSPTLPLQQSTPLEESVSQQPAKVTRAMNLAAAISTPLPTDSMSPVPGSQHAAPVQVAPISSPDLVSLKAEAAALKNRIRSMKAQLDDPTARRQLPNGGIEMLKEAKLLNKQRCAIKEKIEALLSGQD